MQMLAVKGATMSSSSWYQVASRHNTSFERLPCFSGQHLIMCFVCPSIRG